MSFREWLTALERGEWGELHVLFLEKLQPHVLSRAWAEQVERANLLLWASELEPDMRSAALAGLERHEETLPLWAWVFAALRLRGVDGEKLSAEEGIALLCAHDKPFQKAPA